MKKSLYMVCLSFILAGVFVMIGCKWPTKTNPEPEPESPAVPAVDFTDHETASIHVRNNTNQRLVAFRGLPAIENMLGGIPANASNHGLTRTGFSNSMDFVLTLVTESEYNRAMAGGGNQELEKAEKFNVIYAWYNHNGTNNNVFTINSQSGGTGRLIMENPTAWNIEIRKDAYDGQTLGFIGSYTATQTLNLDPGDYIFYPVMRRFNPSLGQIIDAQPVFPDGIIANTPYFLPLQINENPIPWNFREIVQNTAISLVSGGAFVRVVNNSQVAVQFFNGRTLQQTSMAATFLNPGNTMTFQINFPRNPDKSFSTTHTADFGVGVPGVGRTADVPVKTVTMDWLYEIQVSGTNASNVTSSELKEVEKMDIEGLFNAE